MKRWVDIDDSKYTRESIDHRKGAHPVTRVTSIYDIPTGIMLSVDPADGPQLELRFQYLSGEHPLPPQSISERLSIVLGEKSQRLLAARISLLPLIKNRQLVSPESLGRYVEDALKELWALRSAAFAQDNRRRLLGEIVADHREPLFSGLQLKFEASG